ncbi:hypothetical protein B0H11DRAFT_2435683 [Mycena galericulata]|nr:hypothetical protein B0H11DRAFT_2435683 [Mycena galericulata]
MKGITPPRRPPQAHCKPNGASSVSRGPISPMISLTYSHLGQAPLPSISVLPPLHRQPPSSQSTFTLSSPPSTQSIFVMKQTPATHCLPVNGNGAMSPPTANGVTPKSPQSDPHLPHGQSVPECDGHRGTARRGAFLSRKQAEAGGNGFSCTVEKLNSTYLPTWSIDDSPLLGDPPPAYSPDLKGSLPDGNGHTGVSRYAGCLMYMRRMCDVGRGVPRPVSVTRVPDPKKFFQQYATV